MRTGLILQDIAKGYNLSFLTTGIGLVLAYAAPRENTKLPR
mgnify:CR=1 FL=1